MTSAGKRTVTYGRHSVLQTISITSLESRKDAYWVIYIHGGAWRDPTVTSESFDKAEAILRASNLPISGFASISYRLSPHPRFPQNPPTTSPYESRNAKHPDHIRDVEAALAFLQNTYGFGPREMAHNPDAEGGTGVEAVSTTPEPLPPRLRAKPTAIVGVAGIYDLRRLVDTHRSIPAYREFVEGAFGPDDMVWDAVSPAQMIGSRGVEGGWKTGRLVVLAQSPDDELVDMGQREAMQDALKGWEQTEAQVPPEELTHKDRRVRILDISGAHDDAWINGDEIACSVQFAFKELQEMGLAPEA
ncbi:uncharacterized protein N7477_001007 [Penicillium maclennaniae]|uniref:uncharacterized protein n=1 Tax=Penicillium maclennaniae TaxID=1343394 RepID=UPI0025424AA3|nr:uncharacterized protein N7477_001007 [Penicillium maclennaniae]KAJ5684662.1 hypothetical protein N7477_001007 [Penicillium maclennaniae]